MLAGYLHHYTIYRGKKGDSQFLKDEIIHIFADVEANFKLEDLVPNGH